MKYFMISGVTMKLNIDEYIINALKEDITSEDVTTNAIMRENVLGKSRFDMQAVRRTLWS